MEEVSIDQILSERGVAYTPFQILDPHAKSLKSEINKRCRDFQSVDELISYSNANESVLNTFLSSFEQKKSYLPHIYCSTLGLKNNIVDPKLQSDLYQSILRCIDKGYISTNIGIVKITDHSHPVRLATPIDQTCYSLIWRNKDLPEIHDTPVVLGEYTGDIKYVGDEEISDESYSFQLPFKSSAFKFTGAVTSSISQISDDYSEDHTSIFPDQPTYTPDGFEYTEATESSYSPNKSSFYSKTVSLIHSELHCTDGNIKRIGARLLLPNDNEYILSADKTCNEMAFLNHFECVFNNNFNFRINVQWHSVYVDGWPHIILTSIPGTGIKSGDELAADFGENWFTRIRRISENNIKNELVSFRLGLERTYNIEKTNETEIDQSFSQRTELKVPICSEGINGLINSYDVCEICQHSIPSVAHKFPLNLNDGNRDNILTHRREYLLCSGCNRAYHWYCVNRPELRDLKMSSKNWFCFQCISLSLRILPSLIYKIPNINKDLINSILSIYHSNEDLVPGVIDALGSVVLRSTDEVNADNSDGILYRPPENFSHNSRYFSEYEGLEGLTRLKPCYLCYSSSTSSSRRSVGVATLCRIHRLHIAPDYDEFFNSVQYTYNSDFCQPVDNISLHLSLVTADQGKRRYIASIQGNTEDILKSHIKKLTGSKYIIERCRRIICSLRQSLYQSEKLRVGLLYKLEKLRKVQDEYFKTISEGDGMIPVLCIKLGITKINKEFSGRLYQGVVSRYYPKERIFHIEYSDGDREDLDYDDFISLLMSDVKNSRTNIEDLIIESTVRREFSSGNDELENNSQRDLLFGIPVDVCKFEGFQFEVIETRVGNLLNVNYGLFCNNSIFEKVRLIHKCIIQEFKMNKVKDNAVFLRDIPKYEYTDQPRWNSICGSFNVESNLIKYFISVEISRISYKTTTFSIKSKIHIDSIVLVKSIPITIQNSICKFRVDLTDSKQEGKSDILDTIKFSVIEILAWTQNRLGEIFIEDPHSSCNQNGKVHAEPVATENICESSSQEKSLDEEFDSNTNKALVHENWLQKANIIAQALQPYPNGIKWIKETHSWKVIYSNEFGQKISKFFNTVPFDENATVESLYLKACRFVSVSQTNNKVIKMLSSNRRPKKIAHEISNPLDRFIFNEWGNTIEDFLARYNLNNPDRNVYSIQDFNHEINSLRPFPENLEWCDSTFSFIVILPNKEKKSFKLEKFEFNIISCYSSAYNLAMGSADANMEFYNRKIRKYNSRVKNNTSPVQIRKQISKKYLMNHQESSITKKKKSVVPKKPKPCSSNTNTSAKEPKETFCLSKEQALNTNNLSFEGSLESCSDSKLIPKESSGGNSENMSSNNIQGQQNNKLSPITRSGKGCRTIVRALPAPSDPLSRARIIEYSKKADELRPFPHGITWCYRSARFKVRYRRSSDGCWTATSFTPTKYSSVREAFEYAIDKLAAHIDDYKNSNEIPIIPKKTSSEAL
ncbi:PHD domain-containing protein [Cryptosporidium canis]|nr:PHD domain-containing protein [Cryptosporidium canis]